MAAGVPCAPGAVIPLPAPAESGCSDEFALDCTFAACDPERTGMVRPQQVVEYVAAMTGHSGHDGRLQALRRALDPAAAGTALDWARFRTAMGAWIAACRQDGAEEQDVATGDTGPVPAEDDGHMTPAAAQLQGDNMDITTPSAEAAGLRSRARQLAAQNAKLQRDVELAEELNARLAEEIAELQTQLRSSRQALEHARAAVDELDDVKAVVKQLEEENTELRRQARHAEKEQRSLCSQAECLQEENQRLLAEGQGLREQIQAQAARTASLEDQLCRCTALLSARDAALAQAGQRAQELTTALEEYKRMVQELRLEMTRLRQQMGQMRDAWAMRPWCPGSEPDIQATAAVSRETADNEEEEEEEEEEEDRGTALSGGGALLWSSEEVGKAVAPQAPLSPWTVLSPWALALLALLALLYLWPCQWPQLQLHYRSPPPL
ncbi:protein KASH5 isoform X4 [Taeniopygia guttata]|uniref:protein KASH5 isoform X4 n=1 Tax=Taeniopygia guttata TaxID=59729 RepID=UPI003BB8FFC8